MRTDRRKAFYKRWWDSSEEPHEKAEIQHKDLRQGKNLAFSEDTGLEKKRVQSKVNPRKAGEIEADWGVEQEEVGLEVSLVGIH